MPCLCDLWLSLQVRKPFILKIKKCLLYYHYSAQSNVLFLFRVTLDGVILCAFGIFVLCMYVYTMYPDLPGGDSGMFFAYFSCIRFLKDTNFFYCLEFEKQTSCLVNSVIWLQCLVQYGYILWIFVNVYCNPTIMRHIA